MFILQQLVIIFWSCSLLDSLSYTNSSPVAASQWPRKHGSHAAHAHNSFSHISIFKQYHVISNLDIPISAAEGKLQGESKSEEQVHLRSMYIKGLYAH